MLRQTVARLRTAAGVALLLFQSAANYRGFPPGGVFDGLVYLAAHRRLMCLPAVPIAAGAEGNLGDLELTPGVYSLDGPARLNGTLRLDARSEDDAFFVFQIGKTLTTAPNSAVLLLNRGRRNAVYWDIGGSAKIKPKNVLRGQHPGARQYHSGRPG